MNHEVTIQKAVESDISAIIKIHQDRLARDVFPNLGAAFLKKYYESILLSSCNYLFVASDGQEIFGFISLSTKNESFIKLIGIRDWCTLAMNCISRPSLVLFALLQFKRNSNTADAESSEISFIAVAQKCSGHGIGLRLISHAMAVSKAIGKTFIKTKTSNERLSKFYQNQHNAQIIESFNILGERYSVLKWRL